MRTSGAARSGRLRTVLAAALLLVAAVASAPADASAGKFANPIGHTPDPSVVFRDGSYHAVFALGSAIGVSTSPLLETAFQQFTGVVDLGPDYRELWAPELRYLAGHWYIYGCALDPGGYRRMFVVKGTGDDPTTASWSKPVDLVTELDPSRPFNWELDGNVLEKQDGSLYFVFAASTRGGLFPLNLYIAPMADPMTLSGTPVLLSEPTHDWEKVRAAVNEGPAFLYRDLPANRGHSAAEPRASKRRTILVFSASGALGPGYKLGMLVNDNGNVMDPGSWTKHPTPVFEQGSTDVVSPGHNSFVRSPDGTQDWIVYHAVDVNRGADLDVVPGANNFVDGLRRTMTQRFTWSPDGLPQFGQPIGDGQLQDRPSGELP